MKKRVNNTDVRKYVEGRQEFETNNKTMYGVSRPVQSGSTTVYAVYSYGGHFPIYAYDCRTNTWFGNTDKYSRTTSRHQTLARPHYKEVEWVGTEVLREIIYHGHMAILTKRLTAA
jgi:hypothetical protein